MKDKNFDRTKFVWIKDYARINDGGIDVVLFHYPIAVWDKQHRGSIHLYGHIHDNAKTNHPLTMELNRAYNVGVNINGYEPKTLNELLNR